MTVLIREANAADIDILGPLKLEASLAWGDHVEELAALPEARMVSVAQLPHTIVAELEGKIVGFATVLRVSSAFEAEIADLFVKPSQWRSGVGRKLVAEAERRAAAFGAQSILVVSGDRSRPFYEAVGYLFAGTVLTKFEQAVELRKDLTGKAN